MLALVLVLDFVLPFPVAIRIMVTLVIPITLDFPLAVVVAIFVPVPVTFPFSFTVSIALLGGGVVAASPFSECRQAGKSGGSHNKDECPYQLPQVPLHIRILSCIGFGAIKFGRFHLKMPCAIQQVAPRALVGWLA